MTDDEPLDDARAVGTAAVASSARVIESVVRHISEAKARERAAFERAQDQQSARQTLGALEQNYDSTEQRGKRDTIREEAGLPLENRRVIATADQMNGSDPGRPPPQAPRGPPRSGARARRLSSSAAASPRGGELPEPHT